VLEKEGDYGDRQVKKESWPAIRCGRNSLWCGCSNLKGKKGSFLSGEVPPSPNGGKKGKLFLSCNKNLLATPLAARRDKLKGGKSLLLM